jgi:predicted MFS family arabinose efflux permease
LLVTDQLEVWHVVVLLTLHGIAALFHGPATQMIMHDVVGRQDLQSAVRLSATFRQLGVLVGPAIGGLLMLWVGPGVGLVINATMQLPLAVWLLFAPYTGHLRESTGEVGRRSLAPREVVGTVRELSANCSILAMLVVAGLSALLVGHAFQAQMPEFAEDLGDPGGGHGNTALQMAGAGGALLGGLLESGGFLRPSVPAGILCATLFAVSVVAFAAAPVRGDRRRPSVPVGRVPTRVQFEGPDDRAARGAVVSSRESPQPARRRWACRSAADSLLACSAP